LDAQEEERKRIARELHDDVSQQVALLAIRLDALNKNQITSKEKLNEEVRRLVADARTIGTDLLTYPTACIPRSWSNWGWSQRFATSAMSSPQITTQHHLY
jgi:hypothetical protein